MNRIIILGSTGFLGKSLHQKLPNEKLNVKYMIHKKQKNLQKNEFLGDVLDKKSLLKIVKDNDVIVNLVGQYSENLSNFFDINIKGALNLIEIAKIKKNIKIIFASSINVYGDNCKYPSKETDVPNPGTSYGIGKFLTEQLYEKYSKLYGFDMTILRFSNLYGKNKKSGLIVNLIDSTIKNPVYLSHNGNQQRDFLFVDDAVNGIIQVIKKQPKKFQIFNISSGDKISPIQIIKLIEKKSKKKIYFNLVKNIDDEKCIHADPSKAKKKLKFLPKTSILDGLSILVKNSKV
jgi:nucleoside-diphosphate-sugar epimerase